MEIKDIINSDLILLDYEVENKDEFFNKISYFLKEKDFVEDKSIFFDSLIDRENISNTGFGEGFAIPHGKSKTVKKTLVMFIRLKKSIEWGAYDNEPVKNIFLFAIKDNDKNDLYIDALAKLSRKLVDDKFINLIKSCNSKLEILNNICL